MTKFTLSLLAVGIILIGSEINSYNESKVSLSIKNNNPCNLKYKESNKWIGSIYKEGNYEQFISRYHGLRACKRVISVNAKQTFSVDEFVFRFATEADESLEDTHIKNYTNALKKGLGYSTKIKRKDVRLALYLITKLEGGYQAQQYFYNYDKCKR